MSRTYLISALILVVSAFSKADVTCDLSPIARVDPIVSAVSSYRRDISRASATENPLKKFGVENWFCNIRRCVEFSGLWNAALKQNNQPVKLKFVKGKFSVGENESVDSIHYFLVDETSVPGSTLIIDPTYKQFFKGNIEGPEVFVGTIEQLEALFERHQSQIDIGWNSHQRTFSNPRRVARAIYGFTEAGAQMNAKNTPAQLWSERATKFYEENPTQN